MMVPLLRNKLRDVDQEHYLHLKNFFMTMLCLRAGLFEQDIANRFQVSQSTVSKIICAWINFLYLKLIDIPLWPPRELVQMNIPKRFQEKYPSTRVIIDATEIFVDSYHSFK